MSHAQPLLNYLYTHHLIDEEMYRSLEGYSDSALIKSSLLESGLYSQKELDKLESLFAGIPYLSEEIQAVNPSIQSMIPYEISKQERVVCIGCKDGGIEVLTDQAYLNQEPLEYCRFPLRAVYRTNSKTIDRLLDQYAHHTEESMLNSIRVAEKKVRTEESYGSSAMAALFPDDHVREIAEDLSTLKLVQRIVSLGAIKQAQRIIIRPGYDHITVSFTIAGFEHTVLKLKKSIATAVYLKLRYLSDRPLQEVDQIEDVIVSGLASDDSTRTYKVSFIPQESGITCIIQDARKHKSELLLSEAGLSDADSHTLKQYLQKNTGLLSISGLAQSGKTFSAYHILESAATCSNTVSLEDQVEYLVEGIDQRTYSKRPDKDIQTVRNHYETIGLLPLHNAQAQAAYNAAQDSLVVALNENGVMNMIKTLIGLGLRPKELARTCDYGVVSYSFRELKVAQSRPVQLRAEEVASIEEFVSLARFNELVRQEGYEKVHASWKEITWKNNKPARRSWFNLKALYHNTDTSQASSSVFVRALVAVGDVITTVHNSNGSLRELEYEVKQAQKEALLERALLRAYAHQVAIEDVLSMLRS